MSLQSAQDLRNEGNVLAWEEGDYKGALKKFSDAIDMEGESANCYTARAGCHLSLRQYKEALDDSTKAVRLHPKNAMAFYRLGRANFELGNYRAAQTAYAQAQTLGSQQSDVNLWLRKSQAEIEAEDEDVIMPQASAPTAAVEQKTSKLATAPTKPTPATTTTASSSSSSSSSSNNGVEKKASGPQKPVSMKFIQKGPLVECAIYAKNSKVVNVEFTEQTFTVDLKLPDGDGWKDWNATLRTHADIVPDKCSFKRNPYKVIVTLAKAKKELSWPQLEYSGQDEAAAGSVKVRENPTRIGEVASYPSSSKKKKNWTDIDKAVAEEAEKEKLEGDQALNKLFSDLYSKGDENTRRAMVKSMQTSGGTCLSMNWDEVRNTDYESEIKPPSGSEVHKYEV